MSNYDQFIKSAGITSAAFTRSVRENYPAFSKITKSMVCHPDKYGLQLVTRDNQEFELKAQGWNPLSEK